jgi:hypothetical protein
MSENNQAPSAGGPPGIVELITGKIGKVTALCLAIVALGGAIGGVWTMGRRALQYIGLAPHGTSVTDSKNCFQPQLMYPGDVTLSKWDSMDLRLTGRNECKQTLAVHVAFKGRKDRVSIEPPFADSSCTQADNPSCWEQKTLERGDVNWEVSPPVLTPLKKPLGERIRVDVNWIIYNAETRVQVHADTARIWLNDDPSGPAGTGNLARR